jgi:hypothetical protein
MACSESYEMQTPLMGRLTRAPNRCLYLRVVMKSMWTEAECHVLQNSSEVCVDRVYLEEVV